MEGKRLEEYGCDKYQKIVYTGMELSENKFNKHLERLPLEKNFYSRE